MVVKDTNYIIAFYGGLRRAYTNTPLKLFVNQHINFLNLEPEGIENVTFVFNKSDNPEEEEIIKYFSKIKLKIPHKIIYRNNEGFSYGAWEDALKKTAKDYKYSFLIEDDYIPKRLDFLNFFKQKITDNSIFISSYFNNNHASISNGLLINKFLNNNISFRINRINNEYNTGHENQTSFLNFYQEQNLTIEDITDIGYTKFLDLAQVPSKNIINYTNSNLPLLIEPIFLNV